MKTHSWEKELTGVLAAAKIAAREAAGLKNTLKNKILEDAAGRMVKETQTLLRENLKDLQNAEKDGLSSAMIDRLRLTPDRIKQMAEGVRAVARLEDPVGRVQARWKRPNGLKITKVTVPIGVILIIFESRPNVTVECAALCLKSGNAALLRGGKEAFHSNQALASIFSKSLARFKASPNIVNMIGTTDREAVDFLLRRQQDIQLVIPRGGQSLIRKVVENSRIPVIKHYQGICHVYVDAQADLKKALTIARNAKLQRPGVCNAMETLLVHKKVAPRFLSMLSEAFGAEGCEIRGDRETLKYVPWAKQAKAEDYGYEFLDKILAVKVVPDAASAVRHIQEHGSAHTDAIVTRSKKAARYFVDHVDSSSVMVNASTRFADGFEYGFGAEIGISTDKIHARGPMGLEGLTSYKYVVEGNGQIRS
ncbi:MAG TPA: glutamate-5-semialdehyde dehydrogenase [Verrucomicrobiae bacterium]|nr:glutamate-5-semialdehyde dehydrogenase [Verrucomicrobiae bacterium]